MTKQQKQYVILALLLLAGIFYALQTYYLQDKWSAVASVDAQLEQQKNAISQLQQRSLKLNGFETQKNKLKQQIAELDQGLPNARELPELIDFFYSLTKEYNVTGDRIQLSGDGEAAAPAAAHAIINAVTNAVTSASGNAATNGTAASNTSPAPQSKSAGSAAKPNTAGSPGISAIQLQITYSGDRKQILALLQNLQREISRKITLTETNLSVEKDGKMSLSLKAAIYYRTGASADSNGTTTTYPVGQKGFKNIQDLFSASASQNTGSTDIGTDSGNLSQIASGFQMDKPSNGSKTNSLTIPAQFSLISPGKTVNGADFIPFREVIEQLGGSVSSAVQGDGLYAAGSLGDQQIKVRRGSKEAIINNHSLQLDSPVLAVDSRMYISVKDLSVILGHSVNWDANTNTVTVR